MALGLVFIHMAFLHISGRADQVLKRVARPPPRGAGRSSY